MWQEKFPPEQRPIFQKAVSFTVGVRNLDEKAGAGVVITKSGFILVAHHVIADEKSLITERYRLPKTSWRPLRLDDFEAHTVVECPKLDLALIKMRHPPADLAVAKLGDSRRLKIGDSLYRVGQDIHLLDCGHLFGFGKKGNIDGFKVSLKTGPGASGGPIVNNAGEVMGIVVSKNAYDETAPYAFAVPINLARRHLLRGAALRELYESITALRLDLRDFLNISRKL